MSSCSGLVDNLLATKSHTIQLAIFGVVDHLDRSIMDIFRFATEEVEIVVGGNIEQRLILECAESGIGIQNEGSVFVGDESGDGLSHDLMSGDVVGHVSIVMRKIGCGNNFVLPHRKLNCRDLIIGVVVIKRPVPVIFQIIC